MTFDLPWIAAGRLLCSIVLVFVVPAHSQDTIKIKSIPVKTLLYPRPESVPGLFTNIPQQRMVQSISTIYTPTIDNKTGSVNTIATKRYPNGIIRRQLSVTKK